VGKTQPGAWPTGEIESDDAEENPDVGNPCVSMPNCDLLPPHVPSPQCMARRMHSPAAGAGQLLLLHAWYWLHPRCIRRRRQH